MDKMFKKIGWLTILIGILCQLACLDPTYYSFDKSESGLVINEIVARPADGGSDWIELYNAGEDTVYLRDYALVDDSTDREPVPLPDRTLEPGEFFVILATDETPEDDFFYVPFRLGSDDKITLYWGLAIVDELDWEEGEAPVGYSYGRFPDGIGVASTLIPTQGMINKEIFSASLGINEIVASPGVGDSDWIELYNAGEEVVYLRDYALVADSIDHEPFPLPDRTLEPGEFFVILATDEAPEDDFFYVPFRLDSDDKITLYWGLTIVDELDWEEGEAPVGYSYGRFPDGIGVTSTLMPTQGMINKKPSLVINEIVASPAVGDNDWIELYNAGEDAVYLKDYALLDDNVAHEPAILPDIILEPGGFIIILALAADEIPEDDSPYVPFRLGDDDAVTLYLGSDIIDVLDWEMNDAPDGYSYGRLPDGTENVQTLIPSPGEANKGVESFI